MEARIWKGNGAQVEEDVGEAEENGEKRRRSRGGLVEEEQRVEDGRVLNKLGVFVWWTKMDDGAGMEGGSYGCVGDAGTWGNKGRSSLFFFRQSAISLFIALGQLLRTLLRSGER